MAYCKGCIEKDLKIEELKETIKSLQAQLKYREEKGRGRILRGLHPFFEDALQEECPLDETNKKGGGVPGHAGHGRPTHTEDTADEVIDLDVGDICPRLRGSSHREGSKKSHGHRERPCETGEAPLPPPPQDMHELPEGVEGKSPFGPPEEPLRQPDHRTDRRHALLPRHPHGAHHRDDRHPLGFVDRHLSPPRQVPRSRHGSPEGSLPARSGETCRRDRLEKRWAVRAMPGSSVLRS